VCFADPSAAMTVAPSLIARLRECRSDSRQPACDDGNYISSRMLIRTFAFADVLFPGRCRNSLLPRSNGLGYHDGSRGGFWKLDVRFVRRMRTIEQSAIGDVHCMLSTSADAIPDSSTSH
jgi:hypothetical protein